ncbi:hypothetical protein K470DRAFT_258990 [Piedraia hortae CBS 480.64]|uniref:Uncharacterized protein n=1 Tax=Piedraia hortae CBS 480.64 TaxID=1314780 RepID=A0A6A7BVX4_9PEZI|nr:hypothetical protein K470DRAFT_258990 [Piedraia hortae CBS 480.64]
MTRDVIYEHFTIITTPITPHHPQENVPGTQGDSPYPPPPLTPKRRVSGPGLAGGPSSAGKRSTPKTKRSLTCSHCKSSFSGVDRERMYKHIMKCDRAPDEAREMARARYAILYGNGEDGDEVGDASASRARLDAQAAAQQAAQVMLNAQQAAHHSHQAPPAVMAAEGSVVGKRRRVENEDRHAIFTEAQDDDGRPWEQCTPEQKAHLDRFMTDAFLKMGWDPEIADSPSWRDLIKYLRPTYEPITASEMRAELQKRNGSEEVKREF